MIFRASSLCILPFIAGVLVQLTIDTFVSPAIAWLSIAGIVAVSILVVWYLYGDRLLMYWKLCNASIGLFSQGVPAIDMSERSPESMNGVPDLIDTIRSYCQGQVGADTARLCRSGRCLAIDYSWRGKAHVVYVPFDGASSDDGDVSASRWFAETDGGFSTPIVQQRGIGLLIRPEDFGCDRIEDA